MNKKVLHYEMVTTPDYTKAAVYQKNKIVWQGVADDFRMDLGMLNITIGCLAGDVTMSVSECHAKIDAFPDKFLDVPDLERVS